MTGSYDRRPARPERALRITANAGEHTERHTETSRSEFDMARRRALSRKMTTECEPGVNIISMVLGPPKAADHIDF
jgi:hypothetical protein